MYNRLEEIVKKAKGMVFAVCLDEKFINILEKNNKVNLCTVSSINSKFSKIGKKKLFGKTKKVSIKKFKKYVKKKSLDILICNMNEMIKYYKHFIKDTIRFTNGVIHIYATNEIDKEFLISRYNRYNVKIEDSDYKNGYILTIDCSKSKTNLFKNIYYYIYDTIYDICEFIGNVLVS